MRIQTIHHKQGRARSCAELMMSTALGGALVVLAGATPAAADNECGAPVAGVVTCTTAGGPYNSGVRYTSAIELRTQPGVAIAGGLDISGTGSITLPQMNEGQTIWPDVSQTGGGTAVSLVSTGSNVLGFLGDVTSDGLGGRGAFVRADNVATYHGDTIQAGQTGLDIGGSTVSVGVNTITLSSDGRVGAGLMASSTGVAHVRAVTVDTTGDNLRGIVATADGAMTIQNTSLVTRGDGSGGISAANTADTQTTITSGTIETHGDDAIGIETTGGAITVNNTSVRTHGNNSTGILADSAGGAVIINTTTVTTGGELMGRGENSVGINVVERGVETDGHGVTITVGSATTSGAVRTWGDFADGINAVSHSNDVNVDTRNATVVTAGRESEAIVVNSGRAATVLAGAVRTTGVNAAGIVAEGRTHTEVAVGSISTQGESSGGILAISSEGEVDVEFGSVTTTGRSSKGVYAQAADNAELIISGGSVSTSGLSSNALEASGGAQDINITGAISTRGDGSAGVWISRADSVDLTTGDITTLGNQARGVNIDFDPELHDPVAVNVTVGDVATGSVRPDGVRVGRTSDGVFVRNTGTTTITAESVTVQGSQADGIRVDGGNQNGESAGTANVTVRGDIATADGAGVYLRNVAGGAVTVEGAISVRGNSHEGVRVDATESAGAPGNVTVNVHDITTIGNDSHGVLITASGTVNITTGDISTGQVFDDPALEDTGFRATGVTALVEGGGALTIATGDITTRMTRAHGVTAGTRTGDLSITTGDITTHGQTDGISAYTEGGDAFIRAQDIDVGNASTGNYPNAVGVRMVMIDDGDLDMLVGNISTNGRESAGVDINATGASLVRTGNLSIRGLGANGVVYDGHETGTLNLTVGDIDTYGDESNGVLLMDTAEAMVSTGSIHTRGALSHGIQVNSAGRPDVHIGDVSITTREGETLTTNGDGSHGVFVEGTTLAPDATVSITTAAIVTHGTSSDGVNVTAHDDAGLTRIDIRNVTTAGDNARGVAFVGGGELAIIVDNLETSGVGAVGVDVRGGAGAIDVEVVRGETTGAGAHGMSITGQGEVDVTVGSLSASGDGADAVNASGRNVGLTLHGALTGQASAAALHAVERADVDIRAGGEVEGEDVGLLITSGSGTFITNRGSITSMGYAIDTVGGATSITNEGRISGRVHLTDNGDSIANSGEFHATGVSDFGGETDVFNNTGLLTVSSRPGQPGAASFINLERFNNAGVIDLADGAAGDQLTLRDTILHGLASSRILMDLDLRGPTPESDRLTVAALEGVNAVELHVQGRGAVGETGVTLITSGAAQTGNEITVTTIGGGFLQYDAVYDAASREFRVVAAAARQAFEPTRIASGGQTQWRRGADVVSARFDELRDSGAMGLRRDGGAQFWAQAFAGSEEVNGERRFSEDGAESVDLTHDVDARGAQFGVDIVRGLGSGDLVLGLAASIGETELAFQSNGDTAEFSGGGVGVYAHWSNGPLAIGVQAKADRYDLDYRFISADLRDSADGETIGARVDASWRMPATGDWIFESQGSLAWTDTDLGGIEGEAGEVEFGDTRSVLTKAGVRLARSLQLESGAVVQPYVGVHRLHELDGKNASRIHLNNQILDVTDPGRGTWTQFTAGANLGVGAVQGFAQGEATLGDLKGYIARVGVRLNW